MLCTAINSAFSFLGVLYGSFRSNYPEEDRKAMETMLQLVSAGRLKPIVKCVPIEQYESAMDEIMERNAVGKTVFQICTAAKI